MKKYSLFSINVGVHLCEFYIGSLRYPNGIYDLVGKLIDGELPGKEWRKRLRFQGRITGVPMGRLR